MGPVTTGDRVATRAEVLAQRVELRRLATERGLTDVRIDPVGTVVVHSESPGYRMLRLFATDAAAVVGAWVNVIVDEVPAASTDTTVR